MKEKKFEITETQLQQLFNALAQLPFIYAEKPIALLRQLKPMEAVEEEQSV